MPTDLDAAQNNRTSVQDGCQKCEHITSKNPLNGTADPEEELFDTDILRRLDFTEGSSDSSGSPRHMLRPGGELQMRSLQRGDFEKGYVDLLSQLAVVGSVTKEMYDERFASMKGCPNTYFTVVILDEVIQRIVGAVTLVVEQKFIHATAVRGRVEDVVVDRDRRGQDLGKVLLNTATILSKHLGCYKVTLECKDALTGFYEQFGYKVDKGNNYMIQRFRD